MGTMILTGNDVYTYMISGAKNLIQYEHYLNRINVFPVADGDTGTNLAFTMKSIIRNSQNSASVEHTLESISKSARESSYGNSGTIVAGYFNGLYKRSQKKETISHKEFVDILSVSVEDAYESIATPKEGTILTVMREWGLFLRDNYSEKRSIVDLFHASIEHTKHVVEQTKDMLKELKDANTVDAGGKGFLYFIEGIYEFMVSGKVSEKEDSVVETESMIHINQDLEYRYCTEFILEPEKTLNAKQTEDLKSFLMQQGDSVIVNVIDDYVKVHVHTNDPEKTAANLRKLGKISETKVDDMLIQYEIANHKKHSIGVITDSIADLPESYIIDNQITVIPIQMIIDDAVYIDRVTLTGDNTYELIEQAENYPTSSQPTDRYINKTLAYVANHFDHVVAIMISSKMSGTYQKVERLIRENDYDNMHIFDSKLNSGGEGLVVKAACDGIAAGMSIDTLLEHIEESTKNTDIFVRIPDLSYAVRSGRVPRIVGKITNILKLKVIISIDEEGEGIVTKFRSLKRIVKKRLGNEDTFEYVIVHSSEPKKAEVAAAEMTKLLGKEPAYIANVSAVVAAFIGKGAVGVAFRKG